MLSSLGFDSKGPSRTSRSNSKYVLEVPRGFSVHVFKSPSPPAYPQNGSTKADYVQGRPQPTLPWKPSSNAHPRPDPTRKPSFGWNQGPDYERVVEPERSKSRKPYAIYPGTVPDMYIYEPSISSTTDLPGSPSSSSSSDSDSTDAASGFAVEVSSTRASSSTETLDATAYALVNRDASAKGPSPYGQTTHPPISSTRPVIPPGIPVATSNSSARYRPPDAGSSDDGTVVEELDRQQIDRGISNAPAPPAPVRRNSDERSSRAVEAPRIDISSSRRSPTSPTGETDPSLRLPPGLPYATSVSSSAPPQGNHAVTHRATVSLPVTQRPVPAAEIALSRVVSHPERITPSSGKSVRWTEDLICPSPVPVDRRRKGWFNRRGDQLWCNDGRYRAAESGQEYPPDLTGYPEPNTGWMNEEGTRIDMKHRLIPKPPLRPALKRPKTSPPEQILIKTPSTS